MVKGLLSTAVDVAFFPPAGDGLIVIAGAVI